ncbi:hypothetical protein [Floridanema aerugineum]|uniref:Uncharacterized protein n=1 Tax=Floridaenema aerugineum BLCC-F46 TaxID=3153654 RepID=A0ABV4WYW6_9CYAN
MIWRKLLAIISSQLKSICGTPNWIKSLMEAPIIISEIPAQMQAVAHIGQGWQVVL